MVGIIHRILFDLVDSMGGGPAVNAVRERAGISAEQEFQLNGRYSDEEWQRLVRVACEVLKLSPEQLEEALAGQFLRDALTRWPIWFEMSRNSREFLLRQPRIHISLAAGLADPGDRRAVADKFRVVVDEDGITTHYRSPNGHCGLYRALAREIIRHYGDDATVAESSCVKHGARECVIHIRWRNLRAA